MFIVSVFKRTSDFLLNIGIVFMAAWVIVPSI